MSTSICIQRRFNGDWFADTLFSKVILVQGNTCAQVFINGYFTTVHPLVSKGKVAQALTDFADNVGIPDTLLLDGAPEMVGPKTEFMKDDVNRLKIRLKPSEVRRSNLNYAADEREIGKLKKRWRNRMLKRKVPPRLWEYGLVYETNILNRIPRGQEQRTSYILRMVGRWKSDEMFWYLHVLARPIMNSLAAAMLNGGDFRLTPA